MNQQTKPNLTCVKSKERPLYDPFTFATNGTTVMTTTKGYDFVNRLTNTVSVNSQPSTINTFDYKYNTANQRTSVTNVDGSYWVYSYDSMGQVTSGRKYWGDGTAIAGQQFDYSFDDIGNRKTTTRDTRQATYAANTLNQYTGRTVPGFVNVLGTATNAATVSLWSPQSTNFYTPTTRKGDYFRGEMPFNNSTGAMWLTITNVAAISNYTTPDIVTNTIGKMLLAKTPEYFTYDADGNLTNDSLWIYTWDAENRLVKQESVSALPTAGKRRLEFAYDHQSRRIQKLVSTNNGSSYVAQSTNRFIYDGWNLLAILNPQSSILQSFAWGTDLSGSLQGAGGVGGLLMVTDRTTISNAPSTHFVSYDGNGNVTALLQADSGELSARYEYAPFAEGLRLTGPMAKANPFRFSTKYQDDESDQLYYGYRSYNPATGRWLSRDLIGEKGGINLYSFVNNNSPNIVDPYGTTGWGSFDSLPRCKPCKLSKSYIYSDKAFQDAVRAITSQSSYSLDDYEDVLSNALNRASTPPDGPADKWRHCMFVCITFREAGAFIAAAAAAASEAPWIGRGESDPQDALANSYGLVTAHLTGSCSKNCACATQEMPY